MKYSGPLFLQNLLEKVSKFTVDFQTNYGKCTFMQVKNPFFKCLATVTRIFLKTFASFRN